MPQREHMRSSFREPVVEQGTAKEDDPAENRNPVQFAQRTSNHIARQMSIRQNARSKHRRRQHERKENQPTNPADQREQHEKRIRKDIRGL